MGCSQDQIEKSQLLDMTDDTLVPSDMAAMVTVWRGNGSLCQKEANNKFSHAAPSLM